MFNFLKNIGPTELIIIGVIILVFFGANRIAQFGKSAGEATKEIKNIKKEIVGDKEEDKKESEEEKPENQE